MRMKETLFLRVDERFAHLLFGADEGSRLGSDVRLVGLDTSDPRFGRVGALQQQTLKKHDELFFYGWEFKRTYEPRELEESHLFQLLVTRTIDVAGEERGTVYDDAGACVGCGAGAAQRGPLLIPESKLPRRADVARTHADEILLSPRAAELFRASTFSGARIEPVRSRSRAGVRLTGWHQLVVSGAQAEIVPPTTAGINPFDRDEAGTYRCPISDHLLGLNLLSEVSVSKSSLSLDDFATTRQFIGSRRGLLRPWRPVLLRPRVREAMIRAGLKGIDFEVAHLVE